VLLLAVRPLAAAELTTTIDLEYKYEQTNDAGDVDASVNYRQKYEVKYETTISSVFDFTGAARLELEDSWDTDAAGTTRTAPTLELEAKGDQAGLKLSYQAVISSTEPYQETGDIDSFSTAADATLQLTPRYLPEVRLKLQRRREMESWAKDRTTRSAEIIVRQDISGLVLEYDLRRDWRESALPRSGDSNAYDWKGKATYKEVLWGGTELEITYELHKAYRTETERGVFVSDEDLATQRFKTALGRTFDLTTRMSLELLWEYEYEEDLLSLDFETKENGKYQAKLRYDPLNWARLTALFKRETKAEDLPLPRDGSSSVTDNLTLQADLQPLKWLRLAGKADIKWDEGLSDGSGRSLDLGREENYEVIAQQLFGEWWDLTLDATSRREFEDGWQISEESKFRAELKLEPVEDLSIEPFYEVTRLREWLVHFPDPDKQKQTREWKIKFDYRKRFLDMLELSFSHEYGLKAEDELDSVLEFQSVVELNEDTRMDVRLEDLIEGLKLEGEIERIASDTEDDADPMTVDVVYSLKLEYKAELFAVVSTLKYNDKGDNFDDLKVNTRVELRTDVLVLGGEYEFGKIYADETDETRRLNLKLSYKF